MRYLSVCSGIEAATVAWAPLPGAQFQFLTCPVFEALMHK